MAWDGERVWLSDENGRLLAVDGDSGRTVIDRQLDWVLSDSRTLAVGPGELWVIAKKPRDNNLSALRIDMTTGEVNATALDAGRPFGQAVRLEETLVVADYSGAIVAVDPRTGSTRVLVDLDVLPILVQFAPDETYWIVDDHRERLLRVDGTGRRLVDSYRKQRKTATTAVAALVADGAGNAWLAERTAVAVVSPAGETIREVGGFTNVTTVLLCDGAVVASDVETGELAWLDTAGREERVRTGAPGRAIACAPNGVWFVTTDGYLSRVPEPSL